MSQLGFTFYPKDWWTSDSFFLLQPFERYIYLECLFMMYSNDGWILNNKLIVERRLAVTIKDEVWERITGLFILKDNQLTHKSVNSRMRKTLANRENGKLGGRPSKPKKPNYETQKNPPLQREREIEREIEVEREEENKSNKNEGCDFDAFWDLYDKKVGDKSKLKKRWEKISADEKKKIFEYIPKYIQSRPDKQYRKDPATFLNNKSWNDEIISSMPVISRPKSGFTPEQLKEDWNQW